MEREFCRAVRLNINCMGQYEYVKITILTKLCSLTRVKITALYKHLMTKNILTYISNKHNLKYIDTYLGHSGFFYICSSTPETARAFCKAVYLTVNSLGFCECS